MRTVMIPQELIDDALGVDLPRLIADPESWPAAKPQPVRGTEEWLDALADQIGDGGGLIGSSLRFELIVAVIEGLEGADAEGLGAPYTEDAEGTVDWILEQLKGAGYLARLRAATPPSTATSIRSTSRPAGTLQPHTTPQKEKKDDPISQILNRRERDPRPMRMRDDPNLDLFRFILFFLFLALPVILLAMEWVTLENFGTLYFILSAICAVLVVASVGLARRIMDFFTR